MSQDKAQELEQRAADLVHEFYDDDHTIKTRRVIRYMAAFAAEEVSRAVAEEMDLQEAAQLLCDFYDKWEDGTPCYENPEDCEGSLGNAVKLGDMEDRIIAVLNKLFPQNSGPIHERTRKAGSGNQPKEGSDASAPEMSNVCSDRNNRDSATEASAEAVGPVLASAPRCPWCSAGVWMYKGTVEGDLSMIWVKCLNDHKFECRKVADFAQFFTPQAPSTSGAASKPTEPQPASPEAAKVCPECAKPIFEDSERVMSDVAKIAELERQVLSLTAERDAALAAAKSNFGMYISEQECRVKNQDAVRAAEARTVALLEALERVKALGASGDPELATWAVNRLIEIRALASAAIQAAKAGG